MPQHCLQMDCSSLHTELPFVTPCFSLVPNRTVVLTLLCGPTAPAAASRLLLASQCPANPTHGAAPHHQHCGAQGVHGSCSAPAGSHRFSCTAPLLTVLTSCMAHRGHSMGGRGGYVGQDLLQPTCCHLMQSLQPQDLSTAVQHHPPTHNPQPTELQPPAGPASPPHRQCVISPPHPLRLCLKQHLATTLGRSRRAGSYQSCLQPPLLSVSVQHGQGGCRARTKLGTAPRPDPASPAASRQAGNGRSPGPPRVLPAPPRSGCRRAAPLPAPACSDAGGSSQEPLGAGSAASQGRQRRGPRAARRRGGGFSLPTGSAQLGHAAALTAPARMGNGERSLPPQPSRFPRWHRGHAVGERSPSRQPMCAPRLILIEGDKRRRTEEVALLTTVRSR